MNKDKLYQHIFNQAQNNPNVLGLALVGSRGKRMVTEHSDFDIYIIVTDDYVEEVKKQFPSSRTPHKFDITIHTLASFKDYAAWGSSSEWDRYNFAYVKALIDKTGKFQKLIDEKGKIPADQLEQATKTYLDDYIYYFYRSIKDDRAGNEFSVLLNAAESIPCLLSFVFAVERRIKPFNKYLVWELEHHPLESLPFKDDEFVLKVKTILQTGDVKVQKEVFDKVCKLATDKGHAEVVDSWKGCYLG